MAFQPRSWAPSTSLPCTYVLGPPGLFLARCRARLSSMSRIASHNSFTTACRGGNGHGLNDLPQLIVQRLAGIGGVEDLADIRRDSQNGMRRS